MSTVSPSPTARPQAGILNDGPALGRFLLFDLAEPKQSRAQLAAALQRLSALCRGDTLLVGLGHTLVQALGAEVPGLRAFPALKLKQRGQASLPRNDWALCCWLRAAPQEDAGHLLQRGRAVEAALAPALKLAHAVDGFRHAPTAEGMAHDLSGYEDGTENPQGRQKRAAAIVSGQGAGLDGGSFVALQQWRHDFDALEAMTPQARDHMIGRRQRDNLELDDAPASAHVKRTAQESFEPPAFVLRRSMPWVQGREGGLMFVAFGRTLDAFEAQLRRMTGQEDGVVDALFQFSRPLNGGYFWCPPMAGRGLDLRQLGLAA